MHYQKGLGVTLSCSFLSKYWKDLSILYLNQEFHVSIFHFHKVSQFFADKEFCVINGPPEYSKQDIEKKIAEVSLLSVIILIFYVIFNVLLFRAVTFISCRYLSISSSSLFKFCFPFLFPAIYCLAEVVFTRNHQNYKCMVKMKKCI